MIACLVFSDASDFGTEINGEAIYAEWTRLYLKPDIFEVFKVSYGIFTHRAEFRNSKIHKVSYFKALNDDFVLECTYEIMQPNRRKKMDEKFLKEFEEFALSSKL